MEEFLILLQYLSALAATPYANAATPMDNVNVRDVYTAAAAYMSEQRRVHRRTNTTIDQTRSITSQPRCGTFVEQLETL